MTDIMYEEYKEDHPDALDKDPNTRFAFQQGFTSYKSDSLDYILEHQHEIPLTLVLFYNSDQYDEGVMRILAIKLLDVIILKNEKKLKLGANQQLGAAAVKLLETAIPIVLEDVSFEPLVLTFQVLIDYVKSSFIDLSADNLMIPWMYLCYNKEFNSNSQRNQ